ncbi:hypothetical protein [Paenibacillus mesophilus]|uniref:hypothetical protein n=1 Tax=Paenibacillus mesophilus TaxID=2582849 RepID=UPI00130510EE|nr:hypothetical protein [Paenibacillus mesophilus]
MSIDTLIKVTREHIRNTDPTEDEYIRSYLKGMEDVLQMVAEAEGSGSGARRHTA